MAINPPVVDRSAPAFVTSFKGSPDNFNDYLRVYFYFQSMGVNNANKINTQVILAKLQLGGTSLFKTEASYEPFIVWADDENLFTTDRYYIEIPATLLKNGYFEMNTTVSVELMALSNNITQSPAEGVTALDEHFFQRCQARIWDRTNKALITSIENTIKNGGTEYKDKNNPNNNKPYHSIWSTPSFMYPIAEPTFTTYGGLTQAQIEDKFSLVEDAQEETKMDEENRNPLNIANKYYFKCTLEFPDEVASDGKVITEQDMIVAYEVQLLGITNLENQKQITDAEGNAIDGVTGSETRTVLETTNGKVYVDSYWDSTRRSFWHGLEYDFLEKKYSSYELVVTYFTKKGYKEVHSYPLGEAADDDSTTPTTDDTERYIEDLALTALEARPAPEKGAIHLDTAIQYLGDDEFNDTGILIFERAIDENIGKPADKHTDLQWQTCFQTSWHLNLTMAKHTATQSFDDMTVEPGVFYRYRVKFKNWNESQQSYEYATNASDSEKQYVETNESAILFIEDIFLATRDLTLKVKYNPDLTDYKRNVIDIVTPTLGGAYPFVRRNGAQRYRTFNLGGLISYNSELYIPTANDWVSNITTNYHPVLNKPVSSDFDGSLFINYNGKNHIDTAKYNNLVDTGIITHEEKRIIYEKIFRDMVMDFLYDDNVILFKSQSEGNIFIRLSNVSLTPNKQLGRHIYSFTATATEVLETTNANYIEYFSTDYNDNEDVALQNVYILSGMYEYADGELYIGAYKDDLTMDLIGEDGIMLDTQSDNKNYIQSPATWNKNEGYDGGELVKEVQTGSVATATYDTWGVRVTKEGNLPKVSGGTTEGDVTEALGETLFDLHLEETTIEGTQEV